MAVDLATGRILFSRNADVALEPASNEKLMVTYGALTELGPGYRFRTVVLGEGRQVGRVWQGRLVLKGYGDPTLQTDDLQRLAKKLYDRGIRTVTGHVAGDASWFDRRWTAPGWLRDDYGVESAPLSALVVNRAWRGRHLVRDPALAAAALFDQMLRAQGIDARDAVVGRARAERDRARERPLAQAVGAAAADGRRQRQLHGRDGAEGDRRRAGRHRLHGHRRSDRAA